MPRRALDTITVSPPTLDRTDFAALDSGLEASHAPFARDWLLARFAEGLQIRLLRPPYEGFVLFQPGRLAWRPIEGADGAVVVHDLRVADGPLAKEGAARLWSAVEEFTRYYGCAAVLAMIGRDDGLIAPNHRPGRGWVVMDQAPGGIDLVGRVLHGPMALPHFPTDWTARAARLGPGLVVQTTGESARLEGRAQRLCAALNRHGVKPRHMRLSTALDARWKAVRPAVPYTVILDGAVLGGPELSSAQILGHIEAVRRET